MALASMNQRLVMMILIYELIVSGTKYLKHRVNRRLGGSHVREILHHIDGKCPGVELDEGC